LTTVNEVKELLYFAREYARMTKVVVPVQSRNQTKQEQETKMKTKIINQNSARP
jgi:hypothetical protein